MLYLGLGPDDEYESAPPPVGMHPDPTMAPPGDFGGPVAAGPATLTAERTSQSAIRPLGSVDMLPEPSLRPVAAGSAANVAANARAATPAGAQRVNTVRPIPAGSVRSQRPRVLVPRSFNDAQEIGDVFRSVRPCVINLQDANRELSRRLIDFASGLCYGLQGQMEKTADRVYLLIPTDVEISPEDRIELREQGLHDA